MLVCCVWGPRGVVPDGCYSRGVSLRVRSQVARSVQGLWHTCRAIRDKPECPGFMLRMRSGRPRCRRRCRGAGNCRQYVQVYPQMNICCSSHQTPQPCQFRRAAALPMLLYRRCCPFPATVAPKSSRVHVDTAFRLGFPELPVDLTRQGVRSQAPNVAPGYSFQHGFDYRYRLLPGAK